MAPSVFLDLPEELVHHVLWQLLSPHCGCDLAAAQRLSWVCRQIHATAQPVREMANEQRHSIRWAINRLATDVVICASGRGLRAASHMNWRRAFGLPLNTHSKSSWEVRIDATQANQGLLQLGVSLVTRLGVCEWSMSPFYGRLMRRVWDREGELLVGAPPPVGFPDGHLKHMLIDSEGRFTNLEGRAVGSIIEVIFDPKEGYLAFALNGGPVGPRLEGFFSRPDQDSGHGGPKLIKPVVAFRWPDDSVTICSSSGERMQAGWPQQYNDVVRLRDARGIQAARALAERRTATRTLAPTPPAARRILEAAGSPRRIDMQQPVVIIGAAPWAARASAAAAPIRSISAPA